LILKLPTVIVSNVSFFGSIVDIIVSMYDIFLTFLLPTLFFFFKVIKKLMSVAQIGPTHEESLPSWRTDTRDGPINKPFRWDDQPGFAKVPHFGIPMMLNFDWQVVGPGKLDMPQSKESVNSWIKNV
jgi:hypothetical protein